MSTKPRGDDSLSETESEDLSAEFIQAKITGQVQVQIHRANSDVPWSDEVFALNWFNTRSMPLYNFYNAVASRSVRLVGGEPLFKGRIVEQVMGEKSDRRSTLLIVRYPSPLRFKTMLENTYFKIASVLRVIAVSQFTFCMSRSEHCSLTPMTTTPPMYAVHHFRGDESTIETVQKALGGSDISLEFASLKTHSLRSQNANGNTEEVPAIMDGIILLSHSDSATLRAFVESAPYRKITEQTQASFVGLFTRLT